MSGLSNFFLSIDCKCKVLYFSEYIGNEIDLRTNGGIVFKGLHCFGAQFSHEMKWFKQTPIKCGVERNKDGSHCLFIQIAWFICDGVKYISPSWMTLWLMLCREYLKCWHPALTVLVVANGYVVLISFSLDVPM